MSRLRPALRRVPPPLLLLLGVALVLSASWSLATAPMQGPDEADHIGYIEHLAETGHIPSATAGAGGYATDEVAARGTGFLRMYQNPLARPPWSNAAQDAFRSYEDTLPASARKNGDGPNSVGKNPPLYYALEAVGWKLTPGGHFFGRVFVLRALTGLMFLITVVFAWLMAGELFGRRRLPQTITTAVVALLPMDGFMSGIVNTDSLLAAIWAAFLWLALRTLRLGLSWQRAAGLSGVAVLSVLTHGRGLAIMPALVVVLVVAWLVHHRTLRATLTAGAGSVGVLVAGFVVYRLATSAAGAGGSLYGGEVTLGAKSVFSVRQLVTSTWQFYLPKLDSMAPRLGPPIGYRQIFVQQYFTGIFASFEVYFPYWVYDLVQVLVVLLLVVGYTMVILRARTLVAHWAKIVVLVATAGSMLVLLHVASYRALVNGSDNPLIVGRYLLPLTPVLGAGVAALAISLPRRAGAALAVAVCFGLLVLSLGGIGLSLERFYA
jgi:hypothetical protein